VGAVEIQIDFCPTDVKQLEIIEVQFNESHTGNTVRDKNLYNLTVQRNTRVELKRTIQCKTTGDHQFIIVFVTANYTYIYILKYEVCPTVA